MEPLDSDFQDSSESLFNSSTKIFYGNIDLLIEEVYKRFNTRFAPTFNAISSVNNFVSLIEIIVYGIYFMTLLIKRNTYKKLETCMRVFVFFQFITSVSNLMVQKVEFRIGFVEHFTMKTYGKIPDMLLYIFEKIESCQYTIFWFFTTCLLIFRMILSCTEGKKVNQFFFIYLIPIVLFITSIFIYSSSYHMQLMMLLISLIVWLGFQKKMVEQLYKLGVSKRDVLRNKRLNLMSSAQIFAAVFFYFIKYGIYFAIKSSMSDSVQQNKYIFYHDQIFSIIASVFSLINAIFFVSITYQFFEAESTTNVIPIQSPNLQLTAGQFSRRPSTISTFSVSPIAAIHGPTLIVPNMLHI